MPDRFNLRQAAFAVLVLAVVAEMGALEWRQHSLRSPAAVTTEAPAIAATPTTAAAATTTPTTSPPTTTAATTTTSTLPAPVVGATTVTYVLPAGTAVTVTATGTSWLEVTTGTPTRILYADTLKPGTTKSFTSPARLRFGDPTMVSVTAAGSPLRLPTRGPGDLVLQTA